MRHGVRLVVIGVVAAALGVAPAYAAGTAATTAATTTTATTTATTTTTAATTTTATTTSTPAYELLSLSGLSKDCLGAGVAAVLPPSHPVIALEGNASSLGPSAYDTASGAVLTFDSSTSGGSSCQAQKITLSSVSLFGGAISASTVQATDGRGTVTGLEIDGAAVTAAAGETLPVDDWGELTLGTTVGRVRAPLVVRLLQPYDSLPAGTALAVAFAASPVAKPITEHPAQAQTAQKQHGSSRETKGSAGAHRAKKNGRRRARNAPDFPPSAYPFLVGGDLGPALAHNPVVSLAMQYIGIPYQWGGASPKTGFDCSGLVKYVFAQLGVSLPHFAAAQWHSPDAYWVRPNRLQPGDLLFFTGSDGTRKEPGHVGIYIGDGYLIDAPHTGAFVQIDSLRERWFAKNYVGAKRVSEPLAARHLAAVTTPRADVTAVSARFLPHLTIERSGNSVGIADPGAATFPTASAAAFPTASSDYRAWGGAGLGVLLLLLLAGGIFSRRLAAPSPVDLRELWRRRATSRNL